MMCTFLTLPRPAPAPARPSPPQAAQAAQTTLQMKKQLDQATDEFDKWLEEANEVYESALVAKEQAERRAVELSSVAQDALRRLAALEGGKAGDEKRELQELQARLVSATMRD